MSTTYFTTPIYYVNDRPHVGHCYTTLVADCMARFARLGAGRGRADSVFFLTGTDEHAEKVVESAAKNAMTPLEWADRNAAEFEKAFALFGFSNNDFIRTTQPRHTEKVARYIQQLLDSGDIELGDYEGWYDPSQEEYLTESVAKQHEYKSPVTGRDLEKRVEQNYFFRIGKYQQRLLDHIKANPEFIQPEARRNEVVARIEAGLNDIPVSRAIKDGDAEWGIYMPGDTGHRVYVWIDALFNYLSTVDMDDRRRYWPTPDPQGGRIVHLIAKDILWFHAVIWPCLLMALNEKLPDTVYAHSFWVREGRKMSKSLGNFIDLPTLEAYAEWDQFGPHGLDALRYYLLTNGPIGATDADFAHDKFVEVYNADLANGIGNAASRVANMINKYFDGVCPDVIEEDTPPRTATTRALQTLNAPMCEPGEALGEALRISNAVDEYIAETRPFSIAKEDPNDPRVAAILYQCAEALRIAAVLLSPAMPSAMGDLLGRFGQESPAADGSFSKPLTEFCHWGGLKSGTSIEKGDPLFPRADVAAEPPVAVPTA
ncbi:MAG: methionine--tRNA ligase [Planctomycetota bacterium]